MGERGGLTSEIYTQGANALTGELAIRFPLAM